MLSSWQRRWGAELIGWGDRMGSLKEGYWADLTLVRGNPLEGVTVLQDASKILMVVKGGKVEVDRRSP